MFNLPNGEDYYKPIIVKGAFNNNYIQYESKEDKDKTLTISQYLNMIILYLVDMINDHKYQSEWIIQLSAEINFISSKPDSGETRIMHRKSNNVGIMIGSDTNDIIKDLFKSILQGYQKNLEEKMRGSEFVSDGVNLLHYDLNKISIYGGGSYIEPPKWIKNKKATINPQNKDHKCFQYALIVSLNYEEIKKDHYRISKIKPFINQYNWNEIDFPPTGKDWEKFESNNKSIALNILYVPNNIKKIRVAYKSKYNSTRENQVILLMITDGEKWHYLAVKNLSALLREITGNNHRDFYCLNCFCAYTTENKLESHKKICENHDYCCIEMPNEDNKILKYNHGEKSMKAPFIIYADLESLLEKMKTCYDSLEKPSTTKINKHTPSGYSLFTYCSFDETKNKIDCYRGEDCMKKFCLDLREHATKIINYEKEEMIPLTKKEEKKHNKQKVRYICRKEFNTDDSDKKYHKVKDHCHYARKYRGDPHDICNLRYKTPKEIPVVFHNGSTYDYHFIIKTLAEEFEGEFECLGENTEKYITFSVPINKKITKKYENGNNNIKTISYKIKFIDSYRFMSTSLSKLVDNLSEGLHEKDFNKELTQRFANIYAFCNGDLNKFILLLRKGVYPYEYMDNWEIFNEILLPNKEASYSNLNMEDITDTDYRHAHKVFKELEIKNLGEYHDLYVQSDTLLLADVFENFRKMCIKVYELDPAHFLSAPGLAWQGCLKKTKVKLELITDNDTLLMVEKGIRGGMCHAIHRYAKANNKYLTNYDEKNESSYIQYLDADNLYGWAMSQKLPVGGFKWKKNMSKFTEEFIKNYDEDSDKGYILEVDVKYPKKLHDLHSDLPFSPERIKIDKCKKLVCNLYDNKKYVVHIKSLKQALNHGLILKKIHRVIQFNQEACLKPYIDMNTELRKKAKNDFEKDFFKLMNNTVFGKTMENVRKHRDIKLVKTDHRRNKLVAEPNYYKSIFLKNIVEMLIIR